MARKKKPVMTREAHAAARAAMIAADIADIQALRAKPVAHWGQADYDKLSIMHSVAFKWGLYFQSEELLHADAARRLAAQAAKVLPLSELTDAELSLALEDGTPAIGSMTDIEMTLAAESVPPNYAALCAERERRDLLREVPAGPRAEEPVAQSNRGRL